MKNMTIAEMIQRYDLQLFGSDQIRAGFSDLARKEDAIPTLRENKAEILEMLKAAEEEKKAEKVARDAELARMIEVTICGWEATTVYIDPVKALEDQIPGKGTLDYIGISADQALCQIKDSLVRKAEKKAQEIKALEEEISALEGKDLPTAAQAKVLRTNWNNIHNEGGEGFVPDFPSREDLAAMKSRLAYLTKEQ